MRWVYRMMSRVPTREIPFSLAFGVEVVVSGEIEIPSARVENYDEQTNVERLLADLDLLEEA